MSQSTSLEIHLKDLSLDDKNKWRARLKTWLEESRHGQRLQERYNDYMESCSSENKPVTAKGIIAVFLWRDAEENLMFLPKDLHREMYGIDANNQPKKVLCQEEEMVRLAHLGCLDLLEGGWVYPATYLLQGSTGQIGAKMLDNSFKQRFEGESLNWIESSLELYKKIYRPSEHYGKMICFVQSSATGKSRLMAEWAHKRPLLSVCFRDIRGLKFRPEMGWPPADRPICQYFASPPLPQKSLDLERYKAEELVAAFLGALFSVASEKVSQTKSLEDFNRSWSFGNKFESDEDPPQLEKTLRYTAFEQVAIKATKMLQEEEKGIQSLREKIRLTSGEGGKLFLDLEAWTQGLHGILIQRPAEELLRKCKEKKYGKGDFILVFDECAQLNTFGAPPKITSQDRLGILNVVSVGALQRMLKTCEAFEIWSFLIDTTSNLLDIYSVTGEKAPSHRLVQHLKPLHVCPIIQFEVMATKENLARTPAQSLELKFLKFYGRPYWSTLNDGQIIKSVTDKILRADVFNCDNVNQVLAVFSSRVLLELGTTQDAMALAVEGVRHHMRVLTGLTFDGIATTCVPSEPIVAVMASHLLLESDATYQTAMKTLIRKLILTGSVLEKGLQGELLARIILMLSRDAAVSPNPKNPSSLSSNADGYLVPYFSLSFFIKNLIGDPDGVKDSPFYENLHTWAHQYQLNFTHFIQLQTSVKELSIDVLCECWRRGVALVCSHGQPVFDIIFVMYKGDLSTFQWEGFSFVVIQVKNRTSAVQSTLAKHITSPTITRDDGKERWKPAHLVIVMDIGTEKKFRAEQGYFRLNRRKAENPYIQSAQKEDSSQTADSQTKPIDDDAIKKRSGNKWDGYVNEEPESYALEIRNHNPEQYPALLRFAADSWPALWEVGRRSLPVGFEKLAGNMAASLQPFTSPDDFEFLVDKSNAATQ